MNLPCSFRLPLSISCNAGFARLALQGHDKVYIKGTHARAGNTSLRQSKSLSLGGLLGNVLLTPSAKVAECAFYLQWSFDYPKAQVVFQGIQLLTSLPPSLNPARQSWASGGHFHPSDFGAASTEEADPCHRHVLCSPNRELIEVPPEGRAALQWS